MPITWNNYKQPTQPYEQPLASVFNNKEKENMKGNQSELRKVSGTSAVNNSGLTDSQDSSLQLEKPGKNSNKLSFIKNLIKHRHTLATLASIAIIANNGVQFWQNVNNNGNINYPTEFLHREEKVQLDSKKTE